MGAPMFPPDANPFVLMFLGLLAILLLLGIIFLLRWLEKRNKKEVVENG